MNVIIIEDEKPAAQKLKKMLENSRFDIEVLEIIHDVASAVNYLENSSSCDLIFMDIELTDGLSFDIFKQVNVTSPVIFVTAYDEYWQNALTHNGIDYLLKPISHPKLEIALSKYNQIKTHFIARIESLIKNIGKEESNYKTKLLIKKGKELVYIQAEDIAYINAEDKVALLVTNDGRKLVLDKSLSQLESELDPKHFFRVNRKYLVNQDAIAKISVWSKGRIKLELNPSVKNEVLISQENASDFKRWMEG